MSFSRSRTKRFNEVSSCAPPVGYYNPKTTEKVAAATMESADERFKIPKTAPGSAPLETMHDLSRACSLESLTPRKSLFAQSLNLKKDGVASNKPRKPSPELATQKGLEQEIKHLLTERNDLDRKLRAKEEDMARLDGRLQQAQKDKTTLQANYAAAEKEIKDLKKSNDILKEKANTSDGSTDRMKQLQQELAELKEQLRKKDREIADLKAKLHSQAEKAKADIEALKTTKKQLEDRSEQLKLEKENLEQQLTEAKENMEKLEHEYKQVEENYSTIEEKNKELEAAIQEVRSQGDHRAEEIRKEMETKQQAIQTHLFTALDGLKSNIDNSTQVHCTLQQYKDALATEVGSLKTSMRQMSLQKMDDEQMIRHLKGEIFVVTDEMLQEREALQQAQKDVNTLHSQIKRLQETEDLMNDNIRSMTNKYQVLETNLAAIEAERVQREGLLKQELAVTKHSYEQIQLECKALQDSNFELMQLLSMKHEEKNSMAKHLKEISELREILQNQLKEVEVSLCRAQEQNKLFQRDITDLADSKTQLKREMEEVASHCAVVEGERLQIATEYENQMKDIQGQMVILRDNVETKQMAVDDAVKAKREMQLQIEQARHELMYVREQNRTREFLLQEQEKENCRELERAQEAERELKRECKDLEKQKDEVEKWMQRLESQLAEKEEEVLGLKAKAAGQQAVEDELKHTKESLQQLMEKCDTLEKSSHHQIHDLRERLRQAALAAADSRQQAIRLGERTADTQQHMHDALEEKDQLIKDLEARVTDTEALSERVQREQALALDECTQRYTTTIQRLQNHVEQLQHSKDTSVLEDELNRWRTMYEELHAKVLPFQEQLDAFAAEKEALLGMNLDAKHEVEKLGREYAKLLGHQNQKQKIHHVLKLKEENNALKLEVGKLREQVLKQKRQLSRHDTSMHEGKRRFDPSKSFQNAKENDLPPSSPLRQGNR